MMGYFVTETTTWRYLGNGKLRAGAGCAPIMDLWKRFISDGLGQSRTACKH